METAPRNCRSLSLVVIAKAAVPKSKRAPQRPEPVVVPSQGSGSQPSGSSGSQLPAASSGSQLPGASSGSQLPEPAAASSESRPPQAAASDESRLPEAEAAASSESRLPEAEGAAASSESRPPETATRAASAAGRTCPEDLSIFGQPRFFNACCHARVVQSTFNSVQTRCIVKGEAQKSPLFWRFSGGF